MVDELIRDSNLSIWHSVKGVCVWYTLVDCDHTILAKICFTILIVVGFWRPSWKEVTRQVSRVCFCFFCPCILCFCCSCSCFRLHVVVWVCAFHGEVTSVSRCLAGGSGLRRCVIFFLTPLATLSAFSPLLTWLRVAREQNRGSQELEHTQRLERTHLGSRGIRCTTQIHVHGDVTCIVGGHACGSGVRGSAVGRPLSSRHGPREGHCGDAADPLSSVHFATERFHVVLRRAHPPARSCVRNTRKVRASHKLQLRWQEHIPRGHVEVTLTAEALTQKGTEPKLAHGNLMKPFVAWLHENHVAVPHFVREALPLRISSMMQRTGGWMRSEDAQVAALSRQTQPLLDVGLDEILPKLITCKELNERWTRRLRLVDAVPYLHVPYESLICPDVLRHLQACIRAPRASWSTYGSAVAVFLRRAPSIAQIILPRSVVPAVARGDGCGAHAGGKYGVQNSRRLATRVVVTSENAHVRRSCGVRSATRWDTVQVRRTKREKVSCVTTSACSDPPTSCAKTKFLAACAVLIRPDSSRDVRGRGVRKRHSPCPLADTKTHDQARPTNRVVGSAWTRDAPATTADAGNDANFIKVDAFRNARLALHQDDGTTTRGWIWLVVFTPVSFVLLCSHLLSFDVSIKVVELPWLIHGCGDGMIDDSPLNRDIMILGGPSRRRDISVVNERCGLTIFLLSLSKLLFVDCAQPVRVT